MSKQTNKPMSAKKVVKTSFFVDITDVLLNTFVAIITGSTVMLAQALQGLSDLTSSSFILFGIKRSERRASDAYPFGYGRALYFWTLLASLVMFSVLAGLSFYFGFRMFTSPAPIENLSAAFIVLIISIFTNIYSFYISYKRLFGKNIKISAIKKIFTESSFVETKATLVLDFVGVLATIAGLIALTIFWVTGDARFDGLGAMVVGVLMAVFSFMLMLNIKGFIIGKSVSRRTKEKIREAALEIDGVDDVLDLRAVASGNNQMLVNIEIHARDNMVTDELELLIDKVKKNVVQKVPEVSHIQVELETPK